MISNTGQNLCHWVVLHQRSYANNNAATCKSSTCSPLVSLLTESNLVYALLNF